MPPTAQPALADGAPEAPVPLVAVPVPVVEGPRPGRTAPAPVTAVARDPRPVAFSPLEYPALRTATGGASTGDRSVVPTAPPGTDPVADRAARAEARGHAAGYTAGLRQAQRELEEQRARLDALHVERVARLEALSQQRVAALDAARRALDARVAPVVEEAEEALAALALELAEALLGRVLRDDPAIGAVAALERARGGVDPALVVAVRMHPDDVALVAGATTASGAPSVAGTTLAADPSLSRGDAEADLPVGHVDARLTTAARRVREALLHGVGADAALADGATAPDGAHLAGALGDEFAP